MPEPAPSKVQHWTGIIARLTGRDDIAPVWDATQSSWKLYIEDTAGCMEELHDLLKEQGDGEFACSGDGHALTLELVFHREGRRYGMRVWQLRDPWLSIDGLLLGAIPSSMVTSLLAKPTNPTGSGKVGGESAGSNKESAAVKRSTVIRV